MSDHETEIVFTRPSRAKATKANTARGNVSTRGGNTPTGDLAEPDTRDEAQKRKDAASARKARQQEEDAALILPGNLDSLPIELSLTAVMVCHTEGIRRTDKVVNKRCGCSKFNKPKKKRKETLTIVIQTGSWICLVGVSASASQPPARTPVKRLAKLKILTKTALLNEKVSVFNVHSVSTNLPRQPLRPQRRTERKTRRKQERKERKLKSRVKIWQRRVCGTYR